MHTHSDFTGPNALEAQRPRLLVADDHRIVAEGIKHLLEDEFDLLDIVVDGQALVEAIHRCKPDLVISDINT